MTTPQAPRPDDAGREDEAAHAWVQARNPDCDTAERWYHEQMAAFRAGRREGRADFDVTMKQIAYDSNIPTRHNCAIFARECLQRLGCPTPTTEEILAIERATRQASELAAKGGEDE